MAGRDNVLFHANVAVSTAAGTVVPLSLMKGIENVRQGYGTPVLKSVRAFFTGLYASNTPVGVQVEVKNSNWVDSAGLMAQLFESDSSLNRNSLSFMRGRDKVLAPNTAWTINAILPDTTAYFGDIFVLLEIEYSAVEGINADKAAGSPVFKVCRNASVTAAANSAVTIGTFDNLLQNVQYVLSEVSSIQPYNRTKPYFVVIEGFANQKGLTRIIPLKSTGMAEQIEGSVIITKQTYNVEVITNTALSAAEVAVGFEFIASAN